MNSLTEKAKMAGLTAELKEFGLRIGADAIGIAPLERLAEEPQGYKPTDLLPGTKSVVAFVVHQLAAYMENASDKAYMNFGYILKNLYIDRIAWELGRFLDERGFWALPYCREGQTTVEVEGLSSNPFFERRYKNKQSAPKLKVYLRGDINLRHAAEAAGLGRVSPVSGMFMTPEFGPRVRIGVCMTTAELEPTPLITEEFCDRCLNCVNECPAGAISENGPVEFNPIKCNLGRGRLETGVSSSSQLQRLKSALLSQYARSWDEEARLRNDATFVAYTIGSSRVGIRCGVPCVNSCPFGRRSMK